MKNQISPQTNTYVDCCSSGIEGLDNILGGGLPRNCLYLIQGDPGSGKTTLALQFLLEGLRLGEKVFYITLSETRSELLKVTTSHGWCLDDIPLLELSAIESLLRPEEQTTVFHHSEIEMNQVKKLLLGEISKIKPIRVVFDSLSEFRLMAETPLRYRRQLLSLKQEFLKYQSTVLLLDDKMDVSGIGIDPHVLSLTHGVIEMEQLFPEYGISRRRLRVRKLRGVMYREGYHDYIIEKGGIRTFPRLVAAEHHEEYKREAVSSGIKELDSLLGKGLDRGTTTLIIGQAGTGKSTLAMQYCTQMAAKGEESILFTFDETLDMLLLRAKMLDMDIKRFVEDGLVKVKQVDPAELSPGEFAADIIGHVKKGCKLVVIDSLNGYLQAMPGEKYLANQLHELFTCLNQQGVITIVILAQNGLLASFSETPIDISYLADTVLSIRYFESLGEIKQSISVVKKRSGYHEKSLREFKLENGKGIAIGEPLRQFQGVLTGVPEFKGDQKE